MPDHHRPKMAPAKDAPPGIELDGRGNVIPFERRTKDDQQKVKDNLADKIHGTPSEDTGRQPPNTTAT
jgi:hypothetical protein